MIYFTPGRITSAAGDAMLEPYVVTLAQAASPPVSSHLASRKPTRREAPPAERRSMMRRRRPPGGAYAGCRAHRAASPAKALTAPAGFAALAWRGRKTHRRGLVVSRGVATFDFGHVFAIMMASSAAICGDHRGRHLGDLVCQRGFASADSIAYSIMIYEFIQRSVFTLFICAPPASKRRCCFYSAGGRGASCRRRCLYWRGHACSGGRCGGLSWR